MMSDWMPFSEYEKDDWDELAAKPEYAISAALELLHRLVVALEPDVATAHADDDTIDMSHYLGEHPPHLDGRAENTD